MKSVQLGAYAEGREHGLREGEKNGIIKGLERARDIVFSVSPRHTECTLRAHRLIEAEIERIREEKP